MAGLRTKHVPKSKTHPRIQSTVLNSKILSRIQNTSQNPHENISQNSKTLPRIQNTSQNPKTVPRIQNTSQNPKHFWILGRVFRFWEVFLDCDCDQKMSTIFSGHVVIVSTTKSAAWYLSSIVTTRGFTHLEVIKNKMRSKTFSSTYVRID